MLLSEEDKIKYSGTEGWLWFPALGLGLSMFSAVANFSTIFILLYGYMIYLFFEKKKKFPKYYTILLILSVIYSAALVIMILSAGEVKSFEPMIYVLGQSILAIVLVIYMMKSKRVKATFVED